VTDKTLDAANLLIDALSIYVLIKRINTRYRILRPSRTTTQFAAVREASHVG
jgi:hypothetical protein